MSKIDQNLGSNKANGDGLHSFPIVSIFVQSPTLLVSLHSVPTVSISHFLHLCVQYFCGFLLLLSFFHSTVPFLFLSCTVSSWYCSTPLQESQRMQTKLDALTREVFDLQETINWKDKKIGVGGPTRVL